ncbi:MULTISPECIES: ATP-binding protein [Fervidobacterium]|uniref:Putative anti-sigma regulatory factor, serine/threonine protein kinase n=1 Tax=Fervidobacterium nodosum (strain ATCC 35602 / DSM 5306 / Rt17-B1) TaxID=381764 RepID=A7HM02_FERNB|nr:MULTISPECIES: ATP-binding protein [Fervidobacterium]ABS60935.1 putative anti-sigma regulatory factor, serine/threonine protein kinase [Fervidobacterium nodosum Rt17-B1]
MNQTIVFSFPGLVENIKITRAILHTFLTFRGVFDKDIFDTELAINEAIANIIQHTYKGEPKYITMTVNWLEPDTLEIFLRDFGPKVDPSQIKSRDLDDIRPGGLGVYIIKRIFDVMEFKDVSEGNLLYLRKKYLLPPKKED